LIDKVIQNMINENLYDLHTCMLCTIVSFNALNLTATVRPIPQKKYKDGRVENYSAISNVPTLRRKTRPSIDVVIDTPFYQSGDIVVVIFSERALDGKGDRKHDLTDAIILGVI